MKGQFFTKERLTSAPAIIIYLMAANFVIHIATGWQYGFHRDEYYYISMSQHLDIGYVDITPIVPYIMALTRLLFGTSVQAIHVFPALAGSFVILFGGLIARKMGGGRFAQVLTAIAIMAAPIFQAFASTFTYDVFDQLMSAIVIYLLVKVLKGEGAKKTWILLGLMAGIGIMVKITMGLLLLSLIFGLLMTRARKHIANKWFWAAAIIAIVCFIPYVVWQWQRDFPFITYLTSYAKQRAAVSSPFAILFDVLIAFNPVSVLLLFVSMVILFTKKGRIVRPFAWAFIFYLALVVVLNIKTYALAGIFLPIAAFGAVYLDNSFWHKNLMEGTVIEESHKKPLRVSCMIYAVVLALFGAYTYPVQVSMLPEKDLIAYNEAVGIIPFQKESLPGELANISGLEKDYLPDPLADRHGWEELAKTISDIYHSLPEEEQKDCRIFCCNYGQAGAVDYYSDKYDLPPVMSTFLSHYYWGWGDYNGKCLILAGMPNQGLGLFRPFFESMEIRVQNFHAEYALPFETYPILVCRNLKTSPEQFWKQFKVVWF